MLPKRKRDVRWERLVSETLTAGRTCLPGGMVQERAPVLENRRIARSHYRMRLKNARAARRAKPGQFVHVLCEGESGGCAPLLRRPLSLFDVDPERGTMDFIYKVVGLGTEVLARVRPGAGVDFLGPLGRPFNTARSEPAPPASLCEARRTGPSRGTGDISQSFLVGGGVGIPPLYFLAKALLENGVKTTVFLGARTKDWVICAADFRKIGAPVHIATDDGTRGHRGSVVDLVSKHPVMLSLSKHDRFPFVLRHAQDERRPILYICGPTPMMAAAARWAGERGIPAQVSLEERMGCAMGVCMGCVVEVTTEQLGSHKRFQRVCTEGPVFPAEAIVWRNPHGV